jgi:hypothetical protein
MGFATGQRPLLPQNPCVIASTADFWLRFETGAACFKPEDAPPMALILIQFSKSNLLCNAALCCRHDKRSLQ